MRRSDREMLVIRLREAAVEWFLASRQPPVDARDSAFRKVDRKLQRAARAFAVRRTV